MAFISKRKRGKNTYYYYQKNIWVNGKSKSTYKYLGKAEDVAKQAEYKKALEDGSVMKLFEPSKGGGKAYADVAALLSVADRNGFRHIIDSIASKRKQGLSLGDYMTLAAINRAVEPSCKSSFHNWFEGTVLGSSFPEANKDTLSSQAFWNNMGLIDAEKIANIETEISKTVIDNYGIKVDCLLFDNTNFFTYIDTDNKSKLAQRGHSKEKRSDLRIVGLSLMVSSEHNIPLFHEVYPGNMNDARRFSEIVGPMKERYAAVCPGQDDATFVFDRGNNSQSNIEAMVMGDPGRYHFVGGLKRIQFPDLLKLEKSDFVPLEGQTFKGASAYRTKACVYGAEYDVVVTDNPELYAAQIRGVEANIKSCLGKARALQEKILARRDGPPKRGRAYTVESVKKSIKAILAPEHMESIFDYDVTSEDGKNVTLHFELDEGKHQILKERVLGKSILFTNRHEWSAEKIVSAYRAQYHVEECFKAMKDIKYLTFRPIHHWTDNMIRVHAFYCVLALTLCSLMNLEMERLGHRMSIPKMLEKFGKVTKTIQIYESKKGQPIEKVTTTPLGKEDKGIKDYIQKYHLKKYI
jgi:transposase